VAKQVKIAKDIQTLETALKANNTKAAAAAMKQLAIDEAPISSASSSSASSTSSSGSQKENSLSKVAAALKAGDLAGAQSAFATFQSNAVAHGKNKLSSSQPSDNANQPGSVNNDTSTSDTASSDGSGSTFSVTV
jgi:hypothetical protein